TPDLYLKSADEMAALFPEHPEAVANTLAIDERCQVDLPLGGDWVLPDFPVPAGVTGDSFVLAKVYEGARQRYRCDVRLLADKLTTEQKQIMARIDYELEVIAKKVYSAYFLIVADFTVWAKQQGIAVGPGRGSAAGSIVSYCMQIPGIDPL